MCDSLSCPWIWDRRTGLGGHAAWLDLLPCPGELHLLEHKRTGRPEPKPAEEPHQRVRTGDALLSQMGLEREPEAGLGSHGLRGLSEAPRRSSSRLCCGPHTGVGLPP